MSWRLGAAALLAVLFASGMVLLCAWRYGDLAGRWAYLGVALCIVSAISSTALVVSKADEVSESE